MGPQFFEISTLVPAREFNQQYEWSAHEVGARRAGVADAVIDAIKHDRPVAGLPEKEATVIEFGRAMLRGNHQVPSALFAKMVRLFGREGTIEITMIMGDYTMTAMLLNAVDQHLPPDRLPSTINRRTSRFGGAQLAASPRRRAVVVGTARGRARRLRITRAFSRGACA